MSEYVGICWSRPEVPVGSGEPLATGIPLSDCLAKTPWWCSKTLISFVRECKSGESFQTHDEALVTLSQPSHARRSAIPTLAPNTAGLTQQIASVIRTSRFVSVSCEHWAIVGVRVKKATF